MSESKFLQYRISCHNCKLSRYYGMAKLTAHVKATSHAYRMMHEIDVVAIDLEKLESEVIETVSPKKAQTSTEEPPF